MKLARQFKFHYVNMPINSYEAFYESDNEVMVTWNWGNAPYETGSVPYELEYVQERILQGDWVVTEVVADATDNPPRLPSSFLFTHVNDDDHYLYEAKVDGNDVVVTWQWKPTDDAYNRLKPKATYTVNGAERMLRLGMWKLWQEPALG